MNTGAGLWAGEFERTGFGMLAARADISAGSAMLDARLFHLEIDLVAGMIANDSGIAVMMTDNSGVLNMM